MIVLHLYYIYKTKQKINHEKIYFIILDINIEF